jgi:probable O-glycosylation ligase (exosortase A-associated)
MRDLLLALFWSAAIPLSFISPAAGVAFWIWDALLSPTELAYSFMASIPTNKLVAIATLFGLTTKKDKRDVYLDQTGIVLIALSVSVTISWATAINYSDDDINLYLKVIKEIVLAFVVMYLVRGQRWIHICTFMIVVAISFLGVKEGLISLLTVGGHKIIGSRAIGDNNQLAAALIVIIPLLLFLYRQVKGRFVRICLIAAMFLDIITVIMTFSRGGFVGLICLGLLHLMGSKHRIRTFLIIASLAAALYGLAPDAWFSRVDTINDAYDDSSFMGRVIAWKISWLIAENNPFFGGGMHAVQHGMVWYLYSFQLPELAWIPTPPPDMLPHAAHSIVFEILGDLGFVGLTLYTLLFVISYLKLRKTRRVAHNKPELEWAGDLAGSLRFSLILYLVTGILLSVGYFELLFVLFALSSRCLRTATQMAAVRTEPIDLEDLSGRSRGAVALEPRYPADNVVIARRRRYLL